jgi:hypothetical protein
MKAIKNTINEIYDPPPLNVELSPIPMRVRRKAKVSK